MNSTCRGEGEGLNCKTRRQRSCALKACRHKQCAVRVCTLGGRAGQSKGWVWEGLGPRPQSAEPEPGRLEQPAEGAAGVRGQRQK